MRNGANNINILKSVHRGRIEDLIVRYTYMVAPLIIDGCSTLKHVLKHVKQSNIEVFIPLLIPKLAGGAPLRGARATFQGL